jgi:hypothetical protein
LVLATPRGTFAADLLQKSANGEEHNNPTLRTC